MTLRTLYRATVRRHHGTNQVYYYSRRMSVVSSTVSRRGPACRRGHRARALAVRHQLVQLVIAVGLPLDKPFGFR